MFILGLQINQPGVPKPALTSVLKTQEQKEAEQTAQIEAQAAADEANAAAERGDVDSANEAASRAQQHAAKAKTPQATQHAQSAMAAVRKAETKAEANKQAAIQQQKIKNELAAKNDPKTDGKTATDQKKTEGAKSQAIATHVSKQKEEEEKKKKDANNLLAQGAKKLPPTPGDLKPEWVIAKKMEGLIAAFENLDHGSIANLGLKGNELDEALKKGVITAAQKNSIEAAQSSSQYDQGAKDVRRSLVIDFILKGVPTEGLDIKTSTGMT